MIGLKLAGSSLFPFLCISTVQALFYSSGILPDFYIARIISVSNVRRYGHLLKQMIEIWSRGEGLPEVFVPRMTFVTFSYDGGSKLNGMVGFFREGIQLGRINFLLGQVDEKILMKSWMQVSLEKEGRILDGLSRTVLTKPQEFLETN